MQRKGFQLWDFYVGQTIEIATGFIFRQGPLKSLIQFFCFLEMVQTSHCDFEASGQERPISAYSAYASGTKVLSKIILYELYCIIYTV